MYPNYPNQPGYPSQSNPSYGSQYPQAPGGYGMPDPNQSPFGAPPNQYGAPAYPQQGTGYPSGQPGYPPPAQSNYPSYPPAGPGFGGGYPSYDQNNSSSFPPYQQGPPINNPSLNNFGYPTQPAANQYPPSNQYGAPTNQYGPPPSQYGAPPNQYEAPPNQYGGPPNQYPPINSGFDQYNAHGAYAPMNPGSNFGQATYSEGTVKPYQPFNPMDDAAKIYKAMKGFGTNETVLIDILCRRTYSQRQEIAICFKTSYGKDLLENLKSELKGNLELVFKALMKSPAQLEAHDLKKALDGAGTDEEALIDVMCTKTNAEMMELKQVYKQMYHKDLEREVGSDVSGYFKRLMVSLAAAHRSDNPPDFNKAAQQANELYSAGAKSLGTDEVTFNRIFAAESFPHLKAVFDEYYKRTGNDIEKAVKSEMSGYVEKAFCAIINTARNPAAYYAQRLHDAMSGAGTKDRTLVRIVVLRSEKDMVQIKSEFQRRYGKTLESFIKGDCTGDYERALRCLIGDPSWR